MITPFVWMVDSQSEDNSGNFSIFTVNCWRLEIVPLEMALTGLPELQEVGELITMIQCFRSPPSLKYLMKAFFFFILLRLQRLYLSILNEEVCLNLIVCNTILFLKSTSSDVSLFIYLFFYSVSPVNPCPPPAPPPPHTLSKLDVVGPIDNRPSPN